MISSYQINHCFFLWPYPLCPHRDENVTVLTDFRTESIPFFVQAQKNAPP